MQGRSLKPSKYCSRVKMRSTHSFTTCFQIYRCISSSSMCSNINRQSKFINKIMSESRKSKRTWYDTSTNLHSADVNLTDKSPSVHTKRRMIIRNKLFMRHITDMMSMGEVSDMMKGEVEVTDVKITADFKFVNVFYIPNALVDQETLQKCARIIRHELSQLRVIGVVPPIQFIQNKQYLLANEVEKRLAMINVEKDNEALLRSKEMQFDTSDVNSTNQTLYKESFANCDSKADEFYIQLPMMRHDILGLDHHKIMSQITSAVSKSKKAVQRRMLDANTMNEDNTNKSSRDSISTEALEFPTRKEKRKIFSDFLIKRRRDEQRRYNLKQSNKQKILNNFEEVDNEDSNYEDNDIIEDIDESIEEDIDYFEDETRK